MITVPTLMVTGPAADEVAGLPRGTLTEEAPIAFSTRILPNGKVEIVGTYVMWTPKTAKGDR